MKREVRRPVGRPRKDDSRNERFELRLNKEEMAKYDELASRNGMNRSDLMQKSLELFELAQQFKEVMDNENR